MEEISPADRQVEEIESLCMNCQKDGTTRLLLTRIPFFREIVIMSFSCPHCHFQNSEIQSTGEIQQRGVKFTFKADAREDLQRQVIKSDTCVARIEEVDLEIPAGRGQLTNIEGLLSMVKEDLASKQEERRRIDEGLFTKVDSVIKSLGRMLSGQQMPFTLTLSDPAGNSSLEPSPSDGSGKYVRAEFPRSAAQNAALGLAPGDTSGTEGTDAAETGAPATEIRPEYRANQMYPSSQTGVVSAGGEPDSDDIVEGEVYSFPSSCPGCTKPCVINMKMVRIPQFDEVVIMATVCEHCGYRTNEVKSGGKVPEKGRRITLKVLKREDLSRDILKGEHCGLECPELSLTVEPGTLGGRFTTVEGLLSQIRDDLRSSIFDTDEGVNVSSAGGDSMPTKDQVKWTEFFATLDRAIKGKLPFTLIMSDPLAASYVQSLKDPGPDDQITVEEYSRTDEEEENLGLKDMQTEGYEEEEENDADPRGAEEGQGKKDAIDLEEVQRQVQARLAALGTEDEDEEK